MARKTIWLVLFSLAVAAVVGCGGKAGMASVSGQIKHKGKPLPNANVGFSPVDIGKRPATAITDGTGRFTLGTVSPGDGAEVGKYQVSVIARGPERPPKAGETLTGMPGEMMPGDPIIPQKYFAPDSSGLTFEVKRGSNRADFDLTD